MGIKLKFGIIGFGIFGEKRLIPGFKGSKGAELVAIHKRDKNAAEVKAKLYAIPKAYGNIESLVRDAEIDAVFIATPNKFHLDHVKAAAKNGKHILLEKPMGLNAKECQEMIAVCKQNHVQLMVAQCWRYNDTVLRIKQLIDQGALGRLVSLECNFFFNGKYSKREWLWDKELAGGGPVMDLGVHCLDVIRFLAGKEVTSSKSVLVYPKNSTKKNVELKASIALQLEDGIIGNISCGFEGSFLTAIKIIGEKGILSADMFNQIESEVDLRKYSNRNKGIEIIQNSNCYSKEIDDFAHSILSNTNSPIPGIEGLKNQAILDQILNGS